MPVPALVFTVYKDSLPAKIINLPKAIGAGKFHSCVCVCSQLGQRKFCEFQGEEEGQRLKSDVQGSCYHDTCAFKVSLQLKKEKKSRNMKLSNQSTGGHHSNYLFKQHRLT